jgi:hypothetical protein
MILSCCNGPFAQSSQRWGVGFVVIALHGLFGLAWVVFENALPRFSEVKRSHSMLVWLPLLENIQKAPLRAVKKTTPDPKRQIASQWAQLPESDKRAIEYETSPAASYASIDSTQAQRPPLDLTLSRKDLKTLSVPSTAEQTTFQARLPKSVEGQIAEAFSQSGPWIEERIDDDRIRLRKGTMCVTVERTLTAKLDAFSDYARRLTWNVSTPYKCP